MADHKLSDILGVSEGLLQKLDADMVDAGYPSALDKVEKENAEMVKKALSSLGIEGESPSASEVRAGLMEKVGQNEKELMDYAGVSEGDFDFEKVAKVAREVSANTEGFFLKKEYAKEILTKRPPENTMEKLGYDSIEEMLENEDVGDLFSALRFTETDEWMHKTFDVAYSKFTADDFEKRPIDLRVLGDQYKEVAQKYVAKKHHNVSHLKEFGIIFLNPIAQAGKGKFLRDFPLLLHYFHEIAFYSKLFEKASKQDNFNEKFISLLRGDVAEKDSAGKNEWIIVQRYLWKVDPEDPRLFLPRVNPEAIHWKNAQQNLVSLGKKEEGLGLDFWDNMSWVAGVFDDRPRKNHKDTQGELISFEMADNAMIAADHYEDKESSYFYHQREAMWNKLFSEYVGGEDVMYDMVLENMSEGMIKVV